MALMQQDYTFITRNRCQCSHCNDIIESTHSHNFVRCKCGAIFTDGGLEYVRRGFSKVDSIIDLTETRPATRKELLAEVRRLRELGKTCSRNSGVNFYSGKIKEIQALLLKQRSSNLV